MKAYMMRLLTTSPEPLNTNQPSQSKTGSEQIPTYILYEKEAGHVTIRFVDQGCGIPQDQLQKSDIKSWCYTCWTPY